MPERVTPISAENPQWARYAAECEAIDADTTLSAGQKVIRKEARYWAIVGKII